MVEWKQVVDYPTYEINLNGEIRRKNKKGEWIPVAVAPAPVYLMFGVWDGKKASKRYVHREILKAFAPSDDPDLTHVCFKDGDIYNTSLDNLYWTTQSKRMVRRAKENGYARGEDHFKAKLTDQIVREMKAMWATEKYTQVAIAKHFGIHHSTLGNILSGRYWTHVK